MESEGSRERKRKNLLEWILQKLSSLNFTANRDVEIRKMKTASSDLDEWWPWRVMTYLPPGSLERPPWGQPALVAPVSAPSVSRRPAPRRPPTAPGLRSWSPLSCHRRLKRRDVGEFKNLRLKGCGEGRDTDRNGDRRQYEEGMEAEGSREWDGKRNKWNQMDGERNRKIVHNWLKEKLSSLNFVQMEAYNLRLKSYGGGRGVEKSRDWYGKREEQ